MNAKYIRYIQLIVVSASLMAGLAHSSSCDAVPISVSDATSCSNNLCYFNQLANIKVPAFPGSSVCTKFISPDKNIAPFTFNITLRSASFDFSSTNCYMSDDIVANSKGFCGCPNGTPTSCTSCPNSAVIGSVDVCTSGNHNDQSCFGTWFGESGNYCVKTGLSGFQRYKICQYQQTFDYNVNLIGKASNNNFSFALEYDGDIIQYNHPSALVNVTILGVEAQVKFRPEFTVLDLHSPSNVYTFSQSEVNGLNEYDPKKIGFFKTDSVTKVPASLGNQIVATILDCTNNQFSMIYPWIDTSRILDNSRSRYLDAVAPGSVYLDGDSHNNVFVPNGYPDHSSDQVTSVKTGVVFYDDATGTPMARGINYDDALIVPQVLNIVNWWEDGQNRINSSTNVCTCSATPTGTQGIVFCQVCTTFPTAPFWCNGLYGGSVSCRNGSANTINLKVFPTHKVVSHWVQNGELFKSFAGLDTTTKILSAIGNGVIDVLVQFKNYSIQFEHTTVTPKIVSLSQEKSEILVSAKSTTNPGSCYISSQPAGLLHLNPINLVLTTTEFRFPLALSNNLSYSIVIRCYDQIDSKTFNNVPFDGDITEHETQVPSIRNPVDYATTPGHLFGDLDDAFDNNPATHWANTIISIVTWVLISVVTIALIIGAAKLMFYIKSKKMVARTVRDGMKLKV